MDFFYEICVHLCALRISRDYDLCGKERRCRRKQMKSASMNYYIADREYGKYNIMKQSFLLTLTDAKSFVRTLTEFMLLRLEFFGVWSCYSMKWRISLRAGI